VSDSSRSLIGWICWVPLASFVAVEVYAAGFDGWGAWSTGPLFLVPALPIFWLFVRRHVT
jgi:hypothetical protein